MPKRSSKKSVKHKADAKLPNKSEVESLSTDLLVGQKEKNPAAVLLGRLGGLKGGKARADKLSPQRRSEIAQKAAKARWKSAL